MLHMLLPNLMYTEIIKRGDKSVVSDDKSYDSCGLHFLFHAILHLYTKFHQSISQSMLENLQTNIMYTEVKKGEIIRK